MKSFKERYDELIALAVQQAGILPGKYLRDTVYGSFFREDDDVYRELSIPVTTTRTEGWTECIYGNVADAQCPVCAETMVVTDVTEVVGSKFAGTFVDNDPMPYIQGVLRCVSDPSHGEGNPHDYFDRDEFLEQRTVVTNLTMAELVTLLDDLAEQKGY